MQSQAGWQAGAQLRRMGWLLHAHHVETKLLALDHAVKANFNPNQPRVPAGSADGGQWTGGGGGGGGRNVGGSDGSDTLVGSDGDDRFGDLPDIPKERPPNIRDRNRLVRRIATLVARMAGRVGAGRAGLIIAGLDLAQWVYDEYQAYARITAYADPPKTLEELHDAVSFPAAGYEIHHIVEQGPATVEGFPKSQIDARDNLVRIPKLKHQDITGWYATPNERFGGLRPRDYLRGRNWEERRAIGIEALIKFEVLKP
ncbi:MAG: hypothetical protein FJX44_05760 [Alphaproteobacteria bacterium]|nr:hypothetical protein [Alphaproteobacteria bacterium]